MMEIMRFLWAFPVTCLGILVLGLGGGPTLFLRTYGLRFVVVPRLKWVFLGRISGICLGSFIILKDAKLVMDAQLMTHEGEHRLQCWRLGPLMLLAYPLASLVSLLCYRSLYKMNYFEVMARRAAGQEV